jgi:hypothetical protein
MDRRHGLFIAVAIGLAAIAGTYAALQTTDLGAQAATSSEKEIAAADVRLDEQEAALRRAARKRPPKLPKLPARALAGASGGDVSTASGPGSAASAAAAPAWAVSGPGPSGNSGPGSFDDHGGEDDDAADAYEDYLDDRADAMEDAADEAADAWEDAHDD